MACDLSEFQSKRYCHNPNFQTNVKFCAFEKDLIGQTLNMHIHVCQHNLEYCGQVKINTRSYLNK